eukprot:g3067.t1
MRTFGPFGFDPMNGAFGKLRKATVGALYCAETGSVKPRVDIVYRVDEYVEIVLCPESLNIKGEKELSISGITFLLRPELKLYYEDMLRCGVACNINAIDLKKLPMVLCVPALMAGIPISTKKLLSITRPTENTSGLDLEFSLGAWRETGLLTCGIKGITAVINLGPPIPRRAFHQEEEDDQELMSS